MGPRFLSYGRQSVDADDIRAVVDVLNSDWLTQGPTVGEFEDALARTVSAEHAVACSSGTAALHLALLAIGIGEQDIVIVPTMTFLATANAVRMCGAEVVFADVDAQTGLMEARHLEDALNKLEPANRAKVKAVLPVHLGGQPVDLSTIAAWAQQHGLTIIEDACHALGSTFTDAAGAMHKVGDGAFARAATFSFHPVKTIATGEGGAVVTNDPAVAQACRLLANHGMTRDARRFENRSRAEDSAGRTNPWYYEMHQLGYNYRLSDLHCALGLSQLNRLAQFVAQRRALVDRYRRQLATLAPLVRPVTERPRTMACWHLCTVLIDFAALSISRAELMGQLRDRGIGTQVHYIPIHAQPYYRHRYGDQTLAGAEQYYASCLTLPLFPQMTDDDVDRVVGTLAEIVGAAG